MVDTLLTIVVSLNGTRIQGKNVSCPYKSSILHNVLFGAHLFYWKNSYNYNLWQGTIDIKCAYH